MPEDLNPFEPWRPSPLPPSPPQQQPLPAPVVQPIVQPVGDVSRIDVPSSALLAIAFLILPLRLLSRVWRRRRLRRAARVVLFADYGTSRMIPKDPGNEYPAITLKLTSAPPVTILRSAA